MAKARLNYQNSQGYCPNNRSLLLPFFADLKCHRLNEERARLAVYEFLRIRRCLTSFALLTSGMTGLRLMPCRTFVLLVMIIGNLKGGCYE